MCNYIGVPIQLFLLIRHLYLSGVYFGVAPKNGLKKEISLQRDGTACSKYNNHFRLNSQHTWGRHV